VTVCRLEVILVVGRRVNGWASLCHVLRFHDFHFSVSQARQSQTGFRIPKITVLFSAQFKYRFALPVLFESHALEKAKTRTSSTTFELVLIFVTWDGISRSFSLGTDLPWVRFIHTHTIKRLELSARLSGCATPTHGVLNVVACWVKQGTIVSPWKGFGYLLRDPCMASICR